MRKLVAIALLLLSVPVLAEDSTPVSANEIIRKVATANAVRTARLHSYRSTRVYEVDYKGFGGDRHAKMVVNISYAAGQKSFTEVSEEGSKLLINRVIRKALESEKEAATQEMMHRTALTEANYSFQLLGSETAGGATYFVLMAKPLRKDKYLYDGKVWIDAAEYAIARIEVQPAKNPSFWITSATIEHRNRSVQGIWLPASNRSSSKVRLGGKALLTIDYGKYEEFVSD